MIILGELSPDSAEDEKKNRATASIGKRRAVERMEHRFIVLPSKRLELLARLE
jgi:hypothetical protein